MARSSNQKLRLLYLKDYLERCTDEEHPVTTADIREYMESIGLPAERKTVYDDLEMLETYGMDIVRSRSGNNHALYLGSRAFQLPELKLLVDSVQSSRFITPKKSLELIGKLESLASSHQAGQLRRQVWVCGLKSMNESIYYTVDELHAAIAENRRVAFRYFNYTVSGERAFRRDGELYHVSPYALVWDNENYYLIGYEPGEDKIKHFRVDKMTDLADDGPGREGREQFESLSMSDYTGARFGMFSGEPINIRMEFKNELAGAVRDRFGANAILVPSREGYFTVTAPIVPGEPFYGWLFSFGDGVRVLSPESVIDGMRSRLCRVSSVYGEQKNT